MTSRQAYQFLLVAEKCLKQRATCGHNCKSCPYFCSQEELFKSLYYVKDVLKARDPMLYFQNEITQLQEVLSEHADQSEETKSVE